MFNLREVLKSQAPVLTGVVVVVLSNILKDRVPEAVWNFLFFLTGAVWNYICTIFQKYVIRRPRLVTMIIEKSGRYVDNQMYEAAEAYLRNKVSYSFPKPDRFICRKARKQEKPIFDISSEGELDDDFEHVRLKWKFITEEDEDKKYFELSFDEESEKKVLEFYIPHLLASAEEILKAEKVVMLYSREIIDGGDGGGWGSIILDHPATFEKLAMDPELQRRLKEDLNRFLKRKDWYKNVGRAWKRGYLIYGPPGTGKSTLIAAMANHLNFDIYNLDISSINSDLDLRETLLSTPNRSIMIIEDIDCAQLEKRGKKKEFSSAKFTLSGILNVIDGLWSSCGDERIIVFTTNHKKLLERLDPALFRPGRMDMHVPMSYCTMYGFKRLVSTYLDFNGVHQLYGQIEGLLGNLEVTPAEIAEELTTSEELDVALKGVVKFLKEKKCTMNGFKWLVYNCLEFDDNHPIYGQIERLLENLEVSLAEIEEELSRSKELGVALEGVVEFLEKKKN